MVDRATGHKRLGETRKEISSRNHYQMARRIAKQQVDLAQVEAG